LCQHNDAKLSMKNLYYNFTGIVFKVFLLPCIFKVFLLPCIFKVFLGSFWPAFAPRAFRILGFICRIAPMQLLRSIYMFGTFLRISQ
jgi:hypothetical protein